MYQYKVVPIGGVDILRHRRGTGDGIQVAEGPNEEDALEQALNHHAGDGWRLKQILQPDPRGLLFLCVMERTNLQSDLETFRSCTQAVAGCCGCDAP